MSEQNGMSMHSSFQRKDSTANQADASLSNHDNGPLRSPIWKPKSPELRRRKYSLASVMRRLEKKSDENKEELKERKLQKRELANNNKHVKRGIFNLRSRQNNSSNNKNVTEEDCNENVVSFIPPIPSELGYNDLVIEEVEKPRSGSIIHASENILLSDVQRPRSPRIQRNSGRQKNQVKSNSEPPSPNPSQANRHNLSPARHPRRFRFDSGYEDSGDKSSRDTLSPPSPRSPSINLTNADIRALAYTELGRVLQGKLFHSKHVARWSKKITEGLVLKIRRLTGNQKKVVATVFIGEKFPGTVEVFVSSPRLTEQDNFQTVSIQINDIFAWVSVICTNA